MRVLHVGKYYHPAHGGIETMVKELATGLSSVPGMDVTVLCVAHEKKGSDEEINGVRVVRSPRVATLFSQPIAPLFTSHLLRMAEDADIVHLHTPNPLAEFSALFLPKDKPIFVSYHSDVIRQRRLFYLYRPLMKAFLRRADQIIVATDHHIRYSNILPEFGNKCRVIPYGIDPLPSGRNSVRVLAKACELEDQEGKFALFVGRLVDYKGIPVLLDAIRSLESGFRLVIIGEGPQKKALEERARGLGISDRVHFAGALNDPETFSAYFHASKFFVLPSISQNEAFGVVQLEAMAYGKPVVCSNLESGATLVTEDGVSGIHFKAGDPADLGAAMARLFNNEDLCQRMGLAARDRFLSLFTRERMIRSYCEAYGFCIQTRLGCSTMAQAS